MDLNKVFVGVKGLNLLNALLYVREALAVLGHCVDCSY